MLLTPPRLLLVRLCALAMLLAVGLQAGAPFAAPLERTHGSAFSATTHEVALSGERRAEVARAVAAPQPHLPLAVSLPLPIPALATPPAPRPFSTGPPPREDIARRPTPRAPPQA
jgi:hypothetical protein